MQAEFLADSGPLPEETPAALEGVLGDGSAVERGDDLGLGWRLGRDGGEQRREARREWRRGEPGVLCPGLDSAAGAVGEGAAVRCTRTETGFAGGEDHPPERRAGSALELRQLGGGGCDLARRWDGRPGHGLEERRCAVAF